MKNSNYTKRKSIFFLILLFVTAISIFSEDDSSKEEFRIAIFDFKQGSGVSAQEAKDITNIFRTEMINQNAFTILDRENLNNVLEEQKKIQFGICDTTDCNIRLGKLLGANKIMTGKVFKLGKTYHINVYFTDIESGTSEFAERETSSSLDKIPIAIEKLTSKITFLILNPGKQQLSNEIPAESDSEIETVKSSPRKDNDFSENALYFSFLLPGSGQFYNGYYLKGSILFISFFGLLAMNDHYRHEYNSARERHRIADTLVSNSYLQLNPTLSTYTQSIKENSQKEMTQSKVQMGLVSIAIVIVYGYNIIDALLTTEVNKSAYFVPKKDSGFFIHSRVETIPNNVSHNLIYSFGYSFNL